MDDPQAVGLDDDAGQRLDEPDRMSARQGVPSSLFAKLPPSTFSSLK